ncbi:MAG: dual specificity protein phosphatase [Pirellulaceae bacterium]|nr:dual specificity protein phosphatase [Pirellulaceae bacterium]
MWPILKRLYLGDQRDAKDKTLLRSRRITHVLNCAVEIPCYYERRLAYLQLPLNDPDFGFSDWIPDLCQFIDAGREAGRVLVHCRMGLSRSPAAIVTYLCHCGKTVDEALEFLRERVDEDEDEFHPPHDVFVDQIREYFEGEASL